MTIQVSVDITIKTLSHRISRDKRIADSIETDCGYNADKLNTVKSLRNKVRRMGTARKVLREDKGCREIRRK